jgi:hypothetical protein
MKTLWIVGFEIQEERANMVDVLAEQEKMETSVQATNGVCLLCPYYVRLKSEGKQLKQLPPHHISK